MIGDDPTPFFSLGSFAVGVSLVLADGSVTVVTTGIHEDAVMDEDNTGRASNASLQPQITVPTIDGKQFGEGDSVTFTPQGEDSSRTYIILDAYPDSVQTTFTLEES